MDDDTPSMDHAKLAMEIRGLTEQLSRLRDALAALQVAIEHQGDAEEFVKELRKDLEKHD